MKTILKFLILTLAFVPFFGKLPGIILCWGSAPMNLTDPIFFAAGLILCAILVWRRYREAVSMDLRGGIVLTLPALAALLLGMRTGIDFLCDPGALLFGWGVLWILFGWRMFYRLFPVPLLMLLGLPTTMYYVFFPGIDFHWKLAIGCALCIYSTFALMTDFNPIRRRTAFFAAAVIVYALLFAALPVRSEAAKPGPAAETKK